LLFLIALNTKHYIKYSDKSVLNIERLNAFWSLFSHCLYLCLYCCVFVLLPFYSVNKHLYNSAADLATADPAEHYLKSVHRRRRRTKKPATWQVCHGRICFTRSSATIDCETDSIKTVYNGVLPTVSAHYAQTFAPRAPALPSGNHRREHVPLTGVKVGSNWVTVLGYGWGC